MIQALESFGLTVTQITEEMTDKALTGSDRIALIRKHLDAASSSEPYLFVFSVNFFPAISEICRIYEIPYVCWSVDSPLAEIYSDSVKNATNRLFLFDRQQYTSLSSYNPEGIFHLPLCTNPQRWNSIISGITQEDRSKYAADISFIGSLYTEKDPWADTLAAANVPDYLAGFTDGLTKAQLSLTGCNILEDSLTEALASQIISCCPKKFASNEHSVINMDRYIAGQHILGMHASSLYRIRALSLLAERFPIDLYSNSPMPEEWNKAPSMTEKNGIRSRGPAKTLTEMPKIFHLSRINLNMTIYPIRSGLSLRIWDVLGCGGFLLTNIQEELCDHFIPGEDLDTFSCPEELVEKCDYYLSHEDVRRRIAENGYRKVCEKHTYQNRFAEMLRHIV